MPGSTDPGILVFIRRNCRDRASVDRCRNVGSSGRTASRSRARSYFWSAGVEVGGGGAVFCVFWVGGVGSVIPFKPSLKPFNPSPSPLPSSGSRLAPNSKNATTASTIRCHGCNRSPMIPSSARHVLPAHSVNVHCRTKLTRVERVGESRRHRSCIAHRNAAGSIHLGRTAEPLGDHREKAAQVFFFAHG
jgi:hypothetical protein